MFFSDFATPIGVLAINHPDITLGCGVPPVFGAAVMGEYVLNDVNELSIWQHH